MTGTMAGVSRGERLGLSVVGVLVLVAAGCGAPTEVSAGCGGSEQAVAPAVVETVPPVPAVPSIADLSTRLVPAYVPGLAARNVTDPASLIEPGGEPTVESRTSVQGVPAAVLGEPAGPVINHTIIFARGDWSFEIISPTLTVDELIRIAEGVSLQ